MLNLFGSKMKFNFNSSYSLEDLCTHSYSDHNIYGACNQIVRELLKDAPKSIQLAHPLLPRLVQECSYPSNPGM